MRKTLSKNPLWVVFFTIFLDVLGIGILIPIIPKLLGDPSSSSYLLNGVVSLKTGYIILGFLTAIYPICMFFAAPILGQISDKIGRRKVLAFSIAGTAIGYVLFALAIVWKNIPLLFLSRALDGITGGNIAVAQAAIADLSTPENRVKNFGMIGASFGIGFVLGPWLGGLLASSSYISWFNAATPFWFTALLSTINFILIVLLYPETRKLADTAYKIDWEKSIHNIIFGFKHPKLKHIFITIFIQQFGFGFNTSFIAVYFISRFGVSESQIGTYFGVVGIGIALCQALLVRHIAKRYSEARAMKTALILSAIECIILLFIGSWWLILVYGFISALTLSVIFANSTALVSKEAGPDIQGQVLGINASIQSLAAAIPPILAGYIAAAFTPATPIIISAFLLALSALYFYLTYDRTHKA